MSFITNRFSTLTVRSNLNLYIYRYNSKQVRVRFAPSPTGFLHLGGLRTALYNLLFAKSMNGRFILRIEDTDQSRLVEGANEALQNDLRWAGIEVDEGPQMGGNLGPYVQSERLQLYKDQVKVLLNKGSAYHCFCSDRRLDMLRREAVKSREVPKYDNRCRHLTQHEIDAKLDKGEQSCIRFKLTSGGQSFQDLVYGKITYDVTLNEGDPVIMKTDGYPTYHFASVVDDHFMDITHVLRGVEWQISTTKHLLLYRAFNWDPPLFGHLPLLMNADGTKLSKRQGDIKIGHYRESNIFPLALINFIVHSGGGFTKDLEQNMKPKSYTISELASQFDVGRINSHSGKLMSERLLEFNRLELQRRLNQESEEATLVEEVENMLRKNMDNRLVTSSFQLKSDYIRNLLHWVSNRITNITDLLSKDLLFIWVVPTKYNINDDFLEIIPIFANEIEKQSEFTKEKLNKTCRQFSSDHNIRHNIFMQTLRSILSGLKEGPSVAEMMEILGKENTLYRLKLCLNKTHNGDKYIE